MRPDFLQQVKGSVQQDIYTPAFGTITGDLMQSKLFEILDAIRSIVGDSYRDLDQPIADVIQEILNAETSTEGMEFLGRFPNYNNAISTITEFKNGDIFVIETNDIPLVRRVYMYFESGWKMISEISLGSFYRGQLFVKKRQGVNTADFIEYQDYAEGWVSDDLFVQGIWKGQDNPSIGTMQIKTNWSNYTEF